MEKKINEFKIASDAAKRFRMLCEYTFNITEDDGEENIDPPANTEEGGENNQDTTNGIENNNETNSPIEMPTDMPTDMPMDIDNGNSQGATGFNPTEQDNGGDIDENMSDDEVIDVDDLTQSQEETENKVDDIKITMEKGFDKIIDIVDRLNKMIDNSTSNMELIKKEIEKRNPTPIEKLNMRAANDSYPFNISPSDYWKDKEKNSNYKIGGEDEPDAKQYTITQRDIDNVTDFQRISKELNSDEFNQNLMNIFGLR